MRIYRKKDDKIVPVAKEEQVQKYKFSWIELICNTKTGETSATGFCGILLIFIPIILFTVLVVWYFFNMSHSGEIFEILDKLITLITVGAGLLGLRKVSASFAGGGKINIGHSGKKDKEKEEFEEEEEP